MFPLRLHSNIRTKRGSNKEELLTVSIRYKQPEGSRSSLLTVPIRDQISTNRDGASDDFRFASAVAAFGMVLRDSPNKGTARFAGILNAAEQAAQTDGSAYTLEFLDLVRKARALRAEGNE
jgi:Ca-activated chloride channel family protein